MNIESNRQELAGRIVDREIYYCVSSLISTLSDLAQNDRRNYHDQDIHWEEDILPLLESTDFEEAGVQAINDCDDLGTLESMTDGVGFWSDAVELTGFDVDTFYEDADGDMMEHTFETWFADHCNEAARVDALSALHSYIIDSTSDWEEFCRENEVETDDFRNEVYEHWLISGWLQRKLADRGYVTGQLCGLTIWGRCCTGQSIALDYVIQEIACETWPEEVLHEDVPTGA